MIFSSPSSQVYESRTLFLSFSFPLKENARTAKVVLDRLQHLQINYYFVFSFQIASLYAKLNGLKRLYFGGYFIRGNPVTMHSISYGINYWSKVGQLFITLHQNAYSPHCSLYIP